MQYSYQLLKILKSNLEKMDSLLAYGDGESAVKLNLQNEKIISLLEVSKSKGSKSNPQLINEILASCIELQEKCDLQLVKIASEYKKEYNDHLIKRQLKVHLKNT